MTCTSCHPAIGIRNFLRLQGGEGGRCISITPGVDRGPSTPVIYRVFCIGLWRYVEEEEGSSVGTCVYFKMVSNRRFPASQLGYAWLEPELMRENVNILALCLNVSIGILFCKEFD